MFKAVLFDLDGTLLPMDADQFLEEYLKLISSVMVSYIEPKIFAAKLMEATYQMIANLESHRTNQEVFIEEFFASTGLDPDVVMPVFEKFYEKDFHQLSSFCSVDSLVSDIIQKTMEKYLVVIATNPVFPRIAIDARLSWAGIAEEPFSLVTSYENMHYCKPQLKYYLEIVEKIGVRPEDCLMVGNDVEEDLVARRVGMKTFLVDTCLIDRNNREFETDYQGSLADFLEFIAGIG